MHVAIVEIKWTCFGHVLHDFLYCNRVAKMLKKYYIEFAMAYPQFCLARIDIQTSCDSSKDKWTIYLNVLPYFQFY